MKLLFLTFFISKALCAQGQADLSANNSYGYNSMDISYPSFNMSNHNSDAGNKLEPNCSPNTPDVLPQNFVSDYKSFFGPSTQNSLCLLDQNKFKDMIESKGALLEGSASFKKAVTDSEVLIVGEMHLFTDLKARQDLMSLFRNSKGTDACVAFEMPNIVGSYDDFLKKLKNIAMETRKSGEKFEADQRDDFVKYYDSMNEFAHSLGLKTFGVDHPENFEREISIDVRNNVMSSNIDKLINEKKCSAVLLFVGKAHESQRLTPSQPSISTLLKAKSLKVTSVNIQMTYEKATPLAMRTWDVCPSPILEKPLVVSRDELPNNIKLAPKSGEQVELTDFDFTYFLPKGQMDFPCSDCVGAEWEKNKK